MASEGVHIDLANRNQRFLEEILGAPVPYSDWIATVAFYKAVHVAEAVFAVNETGKAQHSTVHSERNHLLKTKYNQIWKNYSPLYRASRLARYLEFHNKSHPSFSTFFSHAKVVDELLGEDLVGVESEAMNLLSGRYTLNRYGV